MDAIDRASDAEERSAADALRACLNTRDLGIVFTRDCECFEGEAYERLYAVFKVQMRRLGAMQP